MAKKNVTFADIAAYTGFSKTTISRYFNNPDPITVENQEKIVNALKGLDYLRETLHKAVRRTLCSVSLTAAIVV